MNISKFKQSFLMGIMGIMGIMGSLFLSFIACPLYTFAAKHIYECKDAAGNILYTDHPKSDPNCNNPVQKNIEPARTINLKDGATVKSISEPKAEEIAGPVKAEPVSDTNASDIDIQNTKYSSVQITTPTNNESVNSCGGQYTINFTTEPALNAGDQARLLIDGAATGQPTNGTSITTDTLERGTHNARVQIINNGQVMKTSEPVNFMFMRNCAKHN